MGTRGVPARYGGFETAVEEVGKRLAARGHQVTVFCRHPRWAPRPASYLGMRLVHLPAVRRKSVETLSHTGLSAVHALRHREHDVAVLFNAANAPFIPLLHARGMPVATHVDGLEWKRAKWGPVGRSYYRWAEELSVRWSDALIADAQGISDYYRSEFDAATERITYGATILRDAPTDHLPPLGLQRKQYHLVVARYEPENHVDVAIEGYTRSAARFPLVVVGSAPYANVYTDLIRDAAARDRRVRLLGAVWDQDRLDQLYAHALTYVHGHSVGGTNPSLLRAMGAGSAVVANDVVFNREVLGGGARFFSDAAALAGHLEQAEADPSSAVDAGLLLRDRVERDYRWDDVTDSYEELCQRLLRGDSVRGHSSGRREGASIVPDPLPLVTLLRRPTRTGRRSGPSGGAGPSSGGPAPGSAPGPVPGPAPGPAPGSAPGETGHLAVPRRQRSEDEQQGPGEQRGIDDEERRSPGQQQKRQAQQPVVGRQHHHRLQPGRGPALP